MKIEFLSSLSKYSTLSIFMKLPPVEAELYYADRRKDGRTDMTQLIVAFRNFVNAPKNDGSTVGIKITLYLAQSHSSSSRSILSY